MKKIISKVAILAAATTLAWSAQAQQMGVTKDQIVLGSIQDLSGPLAGFSKPAKNGMQMRVDEINAAGGVHGRKIKLVVEDSGYDPKKGLLAAQKMVQQDKIFAMAGTIGTAVVMATLPILFEKNIPHVFPLTGAREMYEPLHKLKFSFAAPYFDQIRIGVKWMAKERGSKSYCIIYQDDEFGLEVLRGAEEGLKDIGKTFAEKTSFKRGATDFSAQVAKMKGANCMPIIQGESRLVSIYTLDNDIPLGRLADIPGPVHAKLAAADIATAKDMLMTAPPVLAALGLDAATLRRTAIKALFP